jgi:hypothetical protein
MMREFIGDHLKIDGRMIAYRLITANDYLQAKGLSEKKIEKFVNKNYAAYKLINQVMALKQACFMLRRTSYSCQSLSEDLFSLKMRLIKELHDEYKFDFDDEFVERDGESQKHCKICGEPMIVSDNSTRHGTHYRPNLKADDDHKAMPMG